MKNFIVIGAAGYIAPRHLQAIKETGNNLIAALDKSDSVGILDRYFPDTAFFTEFERFDRYINKQQQKGVAIDYVTICSPNYLHDAHIRFGLRLGADVICEKPMVLSPWNLAALSEVEMVTGKKVFTILQLRLHPDLIKLKRQIESASLDKVFDVEVTYLTARGKWYYASWKGEEAKSGGIATNIGIHFFDLLHWLFGTVKTNIVHSYSHDRASGYLELSRARVVWFLSINDEILAKKYGKNGPRMHRSIKIDGSEIEFSSNFTDLHVDSYREIMQGNGFGIDVANCSVQIAYDIRTKKPSRATGLQHQFNELPLNPHPFHEEDDG